MISENLKYLSDKMNEIVELKNEGIDSVSYHDLSVKFEVFDSLYLDELKRKENRKMSLILHDTIIAMKEEIWNQSSACDDMEYHDSVVRFEAYQEVFDWYNKERLKNDAIEELS